MKDSFIVKPAPFKEFARSRVLYVPVDTASRHIRKAIHKNILKEKQTPFGNLCLLPDSVVLYQCIGAPQAVIALERLAVSSAEEILILGFCGSLNPKISAIKSASITKALSEEGTSRHYFPRKKTFFPSVSMRTAVESHLHGLGLSFHSGAIVSTDAPHRETASWLDRNQKKGLDFVDMETSAVFALAEFHGIQAAALMIVSDELTGIEWKTSFRQPQMDAHIEKFFWPFILET